MTKLSDKIALRFASIIGRDNNDYHYYYEPERTNKPGSYSPVNFDGINEFSGLKKLMQKGSVQENGFSTTVTNIIGNFKLSFESSGIWNKDDSLEFKFYMEDKVFGDHAREYNYSEPAVEMTMDIEFDFDDAIVSRDSMFLFLEKVNEFLHDIHNELNEELIKLEEGSEPYGGYSKEEAMDLLQKDINDIHGLLEYSV